LTAVALLDVKPRGPRRSSRTPPGRTRPSRRGLIIAATAELAGLTVLHLDKDFEAIADITGQSVERLSVG